jgi:GT2 family glycosyltransferase
MTRQNLSKERIFYFANSLLASLQLSFLKPLYGVSAEIITEQELQNRFGTSKESVEAAAWIRQRLEAFRPTLIVFCRYSAAHAKAIVIWARRAGIPTIFHIDDDLLNVPISAGSGKSSHHNEPTRLATIRYLLNETTLVYCSTATLRERLFGHEPNPRVVHGEIYCAHEIIARSRNASNRCIIGYMGTGSHVEDFRLASPAILRILATHPEVTFDKFGTIPLSSEFAQFGDRIRSIAPVSDYSAFIQHLASLDWMVGLCPLAKTPFNAVKANTKWVEYTAAGFAVVASRGTVYDYCCSDGCGALVDGETEWLDAIMGLLMDPSRRETMILRAQKRLQHEYSPEALLKQIISIFEKAHSLQANSSPPPDEPRSTTPPKLPTPQVSAASFEAEQHANNSESSNGTITTPDLMHFDQLMGDHIHGWAWSPDDAPLAEGDRHRIELRCGEVSLGYCTRTVRRADVDEYVGDPRNAKGFRLPGASLNVLWHLFRQESSLLPTAVFGGKSLSFDSPIFRDFSEYKSLRKSRTDDAWQIADMWWANSRLLKFRTKYDSDRGPPTFDFTRLRIYQPVASADDSLELEQVDEVAISPKCAVIAVGVVSPVMPVLLVGCDDGDEIAFTDFIPFPSLLRGGIHESEVAALGDAGGTLDDLLGLSDSYVIEAIRYSPAAMAHTISEISIDLRDATGAEPIFDPTILTWLTRGLDISLKCKPDEASTITDLNGSFVSYIAGHLALYPQSRTRGGGAVLSLPANAVPTIAGLVARRLPRADEKTPSSHLVVEAATAKRRWLVTYPVSMGSAHNLFPTYGANCTPTLTAIAHPHTEFLGLGMPLAIIFREIETTPPVQRLFPVPKDHPNIIPDLQAKVGARSASIILFLKDPDDANETVLASIVGQNIADWELIVVVNRRNDYKLEQLRAKLSEVMPPDFQITEVEDAVNRSAAVNRGAAIAAGDALLVIDNSVVLHDYRTVETLTTLAMCDGVGTVGCMLLQPSQMADGPPVFKSAGYFPGRLDLSVAPHVSLIEPDCTEILPKSIYPVAANGPYCFAIASDLWKNMGGLDDKLFRDRDAEIDLSARLVAAGKVNLCTTLLSAYVNDLSTKRVHDPHAIARLNFWRLADALKASTTIRTL